ncbi:glycogen synthase [Thermodesulfovibrionales bacterium]|nr:glycogen synthase [Thermodesulfovibrionales bacterium]MCL0036901.1 glycogen synthase [Thermodesulfovibrionales bacterium]
MKISIVASEASPFSKTGGLADVTGALLREYLGMGLEAYLFVPLYKKTKELFKDEIQDIGIELDIPLGKIMKRCKVFTIKDLATSVFFIDNEEFFNRDEIYGTSIGDYPDNNQRFIFFCRSILEICKKLGINIDIMHCNDWQTGLIPLYLKTLYREARVFKGTRSLFAIHNLGYQGIFPIETIELTGFGEGLFDPEWIELYGNVNFLKAAIVGADIITTVSKTYAEEILTAEYGFGLDEVLKKRTDSIIGILNGIDYKEWNPSTDKFLPRTYGNKHNNNESTLSGKLRSKEELIKRCSLKGGIDIPLLCFIGRLSSQKGIDILIDAIPEMAAKRVNIVIIGKGEGHYQALMESIKNRFDDNLFFYHGFSESFAHLAYAGSDMFLMPSRYEPCGLGQLIAMRYGTIPIARKTGGLSETVEDGKTGFLFDEYSAESFMSGVSRSLDAYADKKLWSEMVRDSMKKDFSWEKSANQYLRVYSGTKI